MAAGGGKRGSSTSKKSKIGKYEKILNSYWKRIKSLGTTYSPTNLLCKPQHTWIVGTILLLSEVLLNFVIIKKVPYTEIDWNAYMQQVQGFVNGTHNYSQLEGGTGPLVYPAGHVYIFTALYYLTNQGTDILRAQCYFALFYLLTLILVFRIYAKSKNIPPYCLVLMCCTSYRIHSIFLLRLFNDPVAMLFLLGAINLFISQKWTLGCVLYSFAVSVKMNILLFAPALYFVLLSAEGFITTVQHIFLCGFIQIMLGLPFLLSDPVAYISRAFNFGRVFLFQWTVNWHFLPEDIFTNRYFHVALLVVHLLLLLIFLLKWKKLLQLPSWFPAEKNDLSVNQIVWPMFTANFIGVACSRSLHYQFYIWYYHSLAYLIWSVQLSLTARLCILGLIELAWNTYPSTVWSSSLLHLSHLILLFRLYLRPDPQESKKRS